MEAILYLSETPQASDVLQKIRAELTSAIRNALLQHAYDSDIELSFGGVHINSKGSIYQRLIRFIGRLSVALAEGR